METRVRLGMTTVGVDVLRGDFLLNSEKRELLNVAFPSAAARRSQLERIFSLVDIFISRFQEHLLVCLLLTN